MNCKICGSSNIDIIYKGIIRDGAIGIYTKQDVEMYKCSSCNSIWHNKLIEELDIYYESEEYRMSLEGTLDENYFYLMHDKESLEKFKYTGTDIFRNKIVADVGCGCGAFLDYVNGVASKVIGIEPSKKYRDIMEKKGFQIFPYCKEAEEWQGKLDVVVSFDVIEHVEDPLEFLKDIYGLLTEGGKAIIGTPTDAPVMRELLGKIYEKQQLFSTQHLWIFEKKGLHIMADKAGFRTIDFKYFQRYGIDNLLGWIREKEPRSNIAFSTELYKMFQSINETWKGNCSTFEKSDYIALYVSK